MRIAALVEATGRASEAARRTRHCILVWSGRSVQLPPVASLQPRRRKRETGASLSAKLGSPLPLDLKRTEDDELARETSPEISDGDRPVRVDLPGPGEPARQCVPARDPRALSRVADPHPRAELRIAQSGLGWKSSDETESVTTIPSSDIKWIEWMR